MPVNELLPTKISNEIIQLRNDLKLSQARLAQIFCINARTIRSYENRELPVPHLYYLALKDLHRRSHHMPSVDYLRELQISDKILRHTPVPNRPTIMLLVAKNLEDGAFVAYHVSIVRNQIITITDLVARSPSAAIEEVNQVAKSVKALDF